MQSFPIEELPRIIEFYNKHKDRIERNKEYSKKRYLEQSEETRRKKQEELEEIKRKVVTLICLGLNSNQVATLLNVKASKVRKIRTMITASDTVIGAERVEAFLRSL